jgi:hypothetical protein
MLQNPDCANWVLKDAVNQTPIVMPTLTETSTTQRTRNNPAPQDRR